MSEPFDPYHKWLGIPPSDQPANYYRLLGLELYESDQEVIQRAADRQMSYVRSLCEGAHGDRARQLLRELDEAGHNLLDPSSKRAYDEGLRAGQHVARRLKVAVPVPPLQKTPDESQPAAVREPAAKRSMVPAPEKPEPRVPVEGAKETVGAAPIRVQTRPGKTLQPSQATATKKPLLRQMTLAAGSAGAVILILGALLLFRGETREPAASKSTAAPTSPPLAALTETSAIAPSEVVLAPADSAPAASTGVPATTTSADGSQANAPDAARVTADQEIAAAGATVTEFPYTGLVLWLDAADQQRIEVNEQGRVARWYDGSKQRNDAVQADVVVQPRLLAEGGRPSMLRFDGAQSLLVADDESLDFGDEYSLFLVAGGASGVAFEKGDSHVPGGFSFWNGLRSLRLRGRIVEADVTQPEIVRLHVVVGDQSQVRWFIDGVLQQQVMLAHAIDNDQPLIIGRRSKPEDARPFVGNLAEILAYGRALSDGERAFVEVYLKRKWLSGATAIAAAAASGPAALPAQRAVSAAVTAGQSASSLDDSTPAPRGAIKREVWREVPGNKVEEFLLYAAANPQPTETAEVDRLETPEDQADNYGQRLRGYLHPPLDGAYVFSIRANAEGVLDLSTDANAAHKRRIETGSPITLQAGQAYYLEAWHKESTGRDYFSIGWTLPDGTSEAPIPGGRLSVEHRIAPPHAKQFIALQAVTATSSGGNEVRIVHDAIRTSGPSPAVEEYEVIFESGLSSATAFRLEALPQDELPAKGPGRGVGGRCAIAEIELFKLSAEEAGAPEAIRFARVVSDQGADLGRVADENQETIWRINGCGQAAAMTLLLAAPLTLGEARLRLAITCREGLGCFRLLATSASRPAELIAGSADKTTELFALQVNLGGDVYTAPDGVTWRKSKAFDNATFGHEGGTAVVEANVANPVQASALRGIDAFRAVVPNGTYDVTLYFCEYWSSTGRTFAIAAEQRVVVPRLDLLRAAGGFALPVRVPLSGVVVEDGRLDLEFQPASAGTTTLLNAIQIRQVK